MVAENRRDELAELLLRCLEATGQYVETLDSATDPDLQGVTIDGMFDMTTLADAILSSSWLAGQLKQARADGWDEGYQRGRQAEALAVSGPDNPYA